MQQSRLNWCMVLHVHNEETDQLELTTIANDFVSRNDSRQSIFGKFVYLCVHNHPFTHAVVSFTCNCMLWYKYDSNVNTS